MTIEQRAKAAEIIANCSEHLWELTGGNVNETHASVYERLHQDQDAAYVMTVVAMLNSAEAHLVGRNQYEKRKSR
jgi:hypothetical protein